MNNGIFTVELDGQDREVKCNFGTIEELEKRVFQRPIISVLNDALNGLYYTSDIVDTIMAGLKANRDTRFKRDEVGQEVLEKGAVNYLEFFLQYLTFAITGDTELKTEEKTDKKK